MSFNWTIKRRKAAQLAGLWTYKWFGTDALTALYQRVAGAEEGQFVVRSTVIS